MTFSRSHEVAFIPVLCRLRWSTDDHHVEQRPGLLLRQSNSLVEAATARAVVSR